MAWKVAASVSVFAVMLGTAACRMNSAVHVAPVEGTPPRQVGGQQAASAPAASGLYSGLIFSHAAHSDMACLDCHAVENGRPGAPDHDACSSCHEVPMDEPTVAACMFCHRIPGVEAPTEEQLTDITVVAERPPSFADVRFDHSAVADNEASCAGCHGGITNVETFGSAMLPSMAETLRGWAALGGAVDDCAACHEAIRRDVAPADHDGTWSTRHGWASEAIALGQCDLCHTVNECQSCHASTPPQSHESAAWMRNHGMVSYNDQHGACLMCHGEDTCHQCHTTQQPANHTNFFRLRGHGQEAAVDRTKCMVCHKEDFCIACHVGTAPRVVAGSFHSGAPNCAQCHGPGASVPVVSPAAYHAAGADCALCHGPSASVPPMTDRPYHVQRIDCQICHAPSSSVRPVRPSAYHTPVSDCLLCHDFAGGPRRAPSTPYHLDGTDCLLCHATRSPLRRPMGHGPLPPDSCLFCHRM